MALYNRAIVFLPNKRTRRRQLYFRRSKIRGEKDEFVFRREAPTATHSCAGNQHRTSLRRFGWVSEALEFGVAQVGELFAQGPLPADPAVELGL